MWIAPHSPHCHAEIASPVLACPLEGQTVLLHSRDDHLAVIPKSLRCELQGAACAAYCCKHHLLVCAQAFRCKLQHPAVSLDHLHDQRPVFAETRAKCVRNELHRKGAFLERSDQPLFVCKLRLWHELHAPVLIAQLLQNGLRIENLRSLCFVLVLVFVPPMLSFRSSRRSMSTLVALLFLLLLTRGGAGGGRHSLANEPGEVTTALQQANHHRTTQIATLAAA
mmetsp:Transcript_10756/g.24555  ORF Transcript_10756/g.24555 Transcript_10756/m.24555 type:complete len:224 (-) Transcript_10756:85-756(-)